MDCESFVFLAIGVIQLVSCRSDQVVQIDLQGAIVRGYSPYISFLQTPTWSNTGACDSQAVVKVDFSGPYKGVELTLHYGKSPRLWTLDISDSPTGDGYGDDDGTTSNMAEVQILNRQMRIYGNNLPGFMDATSDGGLLIRTIDKFATKGSKASLSISDERIDWSRGRIKDYLDSKFLFTLNGQETLYGKIDYDVYFGFNRVVAGNYRNGSGLCSVSLKLISYPGNECARGTLQCHPDADCIDSVRSSRCRCKKGFIQDGKKCLDRNECMIKNGGCVHFCHNTKGNYTCACREGFQLDRNGKDCIDKNECFTDKGGCQHQCTNTLGGFECKCNQGYSLEQDGISCKLGSWCQKRQGCEHSCTTTQQGTVVCSCRDGYRLHSDSKSCSQTCRVGNGGCQHNCTDTADGVICSCAVDYILTSDNKTCVATCMVNNGGCEKRCKDTRNGPICSCPVGYELHQDQKSCLDVDECSTENGGCSHRCENMEGAFECVCPSGYKVQQDQKTCKDVDECEVASTCDHLCINSPGSYICACRPGFAIYGISHCADKDECSDNNGGCAHGCINTNGSYTCTCNQGYKLYTNGKDCVPDSQCYELRAPPGADMSCKLQGEDTVCVINCGASGRFAIDTDKTVMTTHCGPGTRFKWDHQAKNITLPSCSSDFQAPNVGKKVVFKFESRHCKRRKKMRLQIAQNITSTINAQKMYKCRNKCLVDGIPELQCIRSKRRMPFTFDITVEIELMYKSRDTMKKNCDSNCEMKKTERKLKKVVKKLRKVIKKNAFVFSYAGGAYTANRKSFKSPRGTTTACEANKMLFKDTCVGCSKGTFFSRQSQTCELCGPTFYQDEESQMGCKPCTDLPRNAGIFGAISEQECTIQCEPGHYSQNGFKPCKPCPMGTYQPDYGRLSCQACEGGLSTKGSGAVTFKNCDVKEVCEPGYYFKVAKSRCLPCPEGTYQPRGGQNYCIKCPGTTTTDTDAAADVAMCKSHECGMVFSKNALSGMIQSPNYPGEYPTNVSCVWKIRPAKDRRILVIIPEVFLTKSDKCGDKLVMRKSKNEFSTVTYETCETDERPIAFTARSKRLWVQFTSDGQNTARGFSIPFVTYNPDYQKLIESIVKDGKLYSSFQHQSVLKDRKLLTALMEVIAKPQIYFQYANQTSTIMPESFIRLLRKKVIRFFRS